MKKEKAMSTKMKNSRTPQNVITRLLFFVVAFIAGLLTFETVQANSMDTLMSKHVPNFKNGTVICFENSVVALPKLAIRFQDNKIQKIALAMGEIEMGFVDHEEGSVVLVGEGWSRGGTLGMKFFIQIDEPSSVLNNQIRNNFFSARMRISHPAQKMVHYLNGNEQKYKMYCNTYSASETVAIEYDDGYEKTELKF